jgi:hypothetical protein
MVIYDEEMLQTLLMRFDPSRSALVRNGNNVGVPGLDRWSSIWFSSLSAYLVLFSHDFEDPDLTTSIENGRSPTGFQANGALIT